MQTEETDRRFIPFSCPEKTKQKISGFSYLFPSFFAGILLLLLCLLLWNPSAGLAQPWELILSRTSHGHGSIIKQRQSRCQGRYVYVYKLPPEFNQGLVQRCKEEGGGDDKNRWFNMCGNLDNNGLGSIIPSPSNSQINESGKLHFKPEESWYRTEQFSLEVSFHHRIKTYECNTDDPALASAFYIPYYAGLDLGFNLFSPHAQLKDRLTQRLIGWLSGSPVWMSPEWRHKPHFMALGRISWDFSRYELDEGWGSSFLSQPQLWNVTKLIIERKPGAPNEIAIPYPTSFHPSSYQDIQIWQEEVKGAERKWMATFVGSSKRGTDATRALRRELVRQCRMDENNAGGKCRVLECGGGGLPCAEKPEEVMRAFGESVFCLQPGGDSPTRKAIFDSLLAGCIPVLFDNSSAYTQYLWHLPVQDPTHWSIFLPQDTVTTSNQDVMKALRRVGPDVIKRMQNAIIFQVLPRIIYARKPTQIMDAFHIALLNVLRYTPIPSA